MKLVKAGRTGSVIKELAAGDDAKVEDILHIAGIVLSPGEYIYKNNEHISASDNVEDGDIILIRKESSSAKRFKDEPKHIKWALVIWNISHAPDLAAAERIAERFEKDIF